MTAPTFAHGQRVRFVGADSHYAGCAGYVEQTWADEAGGPDTCLVRVPGVAPLAMSIVIERWPNCGRRSVMPVDWSRYPDDWRAISRRIRERSGGRCEWCGAANGQPNPRTGSRVILTVAHLGAPTPGDLAAGRCWGDPHDKHDVRECNLVALCQSCHLGYDRDEHARNAARTRRARRIAAGQTEIGATV